MADRPDDADVARFHRWFAVEANNAAWPLAELAGRSAEQDVELLDQAHAAALHWAAVGTPLHRARAELLLAFAHAQLGHGPIAAACLARCRPVIDAAGPEPWEVAMLTVVAAAVAAAGDDHTAHATHWSTAQRLVAALDDPEDRAIVQASLDRVPPPA